MASMSESGKAYFIVGKSRVLDNNLCAPWRCTVLNNIFFHEASDISSWINVISDKLKRRDFVAIGLEPGITFANKYSSSIITVVN